MSIGINTNLWVLDTLEENLSITTIRCEACSLQLKARKMHKRNHFLIVKHMFWWKALDNWQSKSSGWQPKRVFLFNFLSRVATEGYRTSCVSERIKQFHYCDKFTNFKWRKTISQWCKSNANELYSCMACT